MGDLIGHLDELWAPGIELRGGSAGGRCEPGNEYARHGGLSGRAAEDEEVEGVETGRLCYPGEGVGVGRQC